MKKKYVIIHLSISRKLDNLMRKYCLEYKISRSEMAQKALECYLDACKPELKALKHLTKMKNRNNKKEICPLDIMEE